jgi:predicted DNA-binding WGR domain protein
MRQSKRDKLMNCSTFDELLNVEYGEPGTESRKLFDDETQAFCLAQTLKEERLRAGLTQNVFNRQKCL